MKIYCLRHPKIQSAWRRYSGTDGDNGRATKMIARLLERLRAPKREKPADWTRRLNAAVDALKDMNASTESDFLSLGDRLQEFYGQARDISASSSAISKRMSGEETNAVESELRAIFGRVEKMDDESKRGLEVLATIMKGFDELRGGLGGFEKIVRNLLVLCTFVKIESARIKDRDGGFESLVEDIRKLALNIGTQSHTLLTQTEMLHGQIRKTVSEINQSQAKLEMHGKVIFHDMTERINTLAERNEHSSALIKGFGSRWVAITKSIGEIVLSIQFHDITRQQIEHVNDGLKDAVAKLEIDRPGGRKDGVAGGARRGNGSPDEMHRQVSGAAAICRLQAAQLAHADMEMSSAVERIIGSLQNVASQTAAMSDETKQLVGVDEKEEQSFLADLETGLSKLPAVLADYTSVVSELRSATAKVPETVDKMSQLVKIIEKIGNDMKIVALNAAIHAARIGDEGNALGVLAASLHEMSVDTAKLIERISEDLESLIKAAHELSGDGQRSSRDVSDGQMSHYLKQMLEPLRQLNEDVLSMVAGMDESVKRLTLDIESAAAGFSVHKKIGKIIHSAKDDLESIISQMHSSLPPDVISAEAAELGKAEQRYTMEKERDIHQAVFGAGAVAAVMLSGKEAKRSDDDVTLFDEEQTQAVDNVELFGDGEGKPGDNAAPLCEAGAQSPESAGRPAGDGEDLGDNVELF